MVSNNEIGYLRFIADALNFRIVFDNQQMALVLVLNKDMAEYVASKLVILIGNQDRHRPFLPHQQIWMI